MLARPLGRAARAAAEAQIDFFICWITESADSYKMRAKEPPSRNVQNAMVQGCRIRLDVDGQFCGQPVAPITNAVHCIDHYQMLVHKLCKKLGRPWCSKHATGECESEKNDYEPANNLQRLSDPGRPSAMYMASGYLELGHHCAACGIRTSAVAKENAEILGRRNRILRGKRLIDDFKEMPGLTNIDEARLEIARDAIDTLARKRQALEKAEDEIMQGLEAILATVGPSAGLE